MSDYENGYSNDSNTNDDIVVEVRESNQYDDMNDSGRYRYNDADYYGAPNRESRPKKTKRGGGMKKFVKLVASAFLFGIIAGGTMTGVSMAGKHFLPSNLSKVEVTNATEDTEKDTDKTNKNKTTATDTLVKTTDVSDIVEQVMPSVVSITCTIRQTSYFYGTRESQGAGSGFIIAKNNQHLYIATNNHVVAGATSLTVGFSDGSTANAEIVGTDSDADLAVISVKEADVSAETAGKIKIAVLGNSDNLKVGESVIAIGNALGYGQSVTTGVLSAKDREVSFTDGIMILLQTDAAINPGNSGGVLINQRGEVIGINNAKLEDTSVEGMGYAIPISTANGILNDIMNATTINEDDMAYLGVVGKNIDATYSQALGIPSGIYVSQIIAGSPAEKAGICAGDIIVAFDGNNVSTMTALKAKIERKTAGSDVEITLKRANQNGEYKEQSIKVTLGRRGDYKDAVVEDNSQNEQNNQQGNDYYNNPNGGNNGNGGNGGYDNNGGYYDNNDDNTYIDPFEYFFGNGGGFFR